jgi:hypothetical protein
MSEITEGPSPASGGGAEEAKKYGKGAVKPGVSKTTGKADGRLTAGGNSRNRGKPRK